MPHSDTICHRHTQSRFKVLPLPLHCSIALYDYIIMLVPCLIGGGCRVPIWPWPSSGLSVGIGPPPAGKEFCMDRCIGKFIVRIVLKWLLNLAVVTRRVFRSLNSQKFLSGRAPSRTTQRKLKYSAPQAPDPLADGLRGRGGEGKGREGGGERERHAPSFSSYRSVSGSRQQLIRS